MSEDFGLGDRALQSRDAVELARMRSYEGKKITSPSRGFEV